MFDIPFAGDNSLRASAVYLSNIRDSYFKNEGAVKNTEHYDSDGDIEPIMTYDYLDGTHENPETKKQEYIYNSLVVVRERQ